MKNMNSIEEPGGGTSVASTLAPAAQQKLRLALVGCGANTRTNHLPAARAAAWIEPVALVDQRISRAQQLAQEYSVGHVFDDYRAVTGVADAAVIALPNYLHAPVAINLLKSGVHVFVEKPMALNTAECDAMIAAAETSGATLAVGLEFRYFAEFQFIKRFLSAGLLGPIKSFDMRLGVIFDWPLETDYLLHRGEAGGGVLMDLGVHVLDLLLWWLGDYRGVKYADDARGGVEANSLLEMQLASGASGKVELSRTRNLRNSFIVAGERGGLEIALWNDNPEVRLILNKNDSLLRGRIENKSGALTCEEAFIAELEDFAQAIQQRRAPMISGHEARQSIALIQTCYENRRPLRLPWSF